MKINKFNILEILLIIIFFLFSSNFINQPNYIFLGITIISLFYIFIKKINIYLTSELLVLTICFTFYFFIYFNYYEISLQSIITFWLGPSIAYFIGYHLIDEQSKFNFKNLIYAMTFGMFLHGFLNMVLFNIQGGVGRIIPDIWLGIGIAATLQGTFFTMICSLLFYSLFITNNKKEKLLIIFIILFSLYSSLQTASRTLIAITIIIFLLNTILYLYLNKSNLFKIFKFVLCLTIIISVVIIIFKFNLFNINEVYENSAFYERINMKQQTSVNEDPRFDFYKAILNSMFKYPMGGKKILQISYAHNLWLDTINIVGIIPGFLLIIYSFMTVNTIIKFLKCETILEKYKYLAVSTYGALILNFMVEPILEGVPYMFLIMCIINGATKRILSFKFIKEEFN